MIFSGRTATIALSFLLVGSLVFTASVYAQSTVYTGNVIASETGTTNVVGGNASFNDLATTGVSVNITGMSSSSTTATVTTQLLSGSSPGTPPYSGSSSDVYIDVQVTIPPGTPSQPGATVSICTTNAVVTTGDTLHFWDGSHWATATHVTVSGDTICGSVPLSALTGTNFVISQLAAPVTQSPGIPIYVWLIIPVAAVVVIGAVVWMLRMRKATTAGATPTLTS